MNSYLKWKFSGKIIAIENVKDETIKLELANFHAGKARCMKIKLEVNKIGGKN